MDRRGRRRRWSLLFAVVASVIGSVFIASPVNALDFDNMFPTANYPAPCQYGTVSSGSFCQTDNRSITIFRQSTIASSGSTTISNVFHNSVNPTVLEGSNENPPAYSGGAETDIIYQSGSLPTNTLGYTWCDDPVSSMQCDQHFIRFYTGQPSESLACHETGHAVGLTHGQEASPRVSNSDARLGCMNSLANYFGSHNAATINATY